MSEQHETLVVPEVLAAKLCEVLRRATGDASDEKCPKYPIRATETMRRIGREERPRMRTFFGASSTEGVDPSALGIAGRMVSHACEDVLVSLCAMEGKVDEAAPRSGVDAAIAKDALRRHPLVQDALAKAMALVEHFSVLAEEIGSQEKL